jgi:hypothetical protein
LHDACQARKTSSANSNPVTPCRTFTDIYTMNETREPFHKNFAARSEPSVAIENPRASRIRYNTETMESSSRARTSYIWQL